MNTVDNQANQPPEHEPGGQPGVSPRTKRNRWTLIAIVIVCLAPVLASYTMFYFFPPQGRTNYGVLIEPQQDLAPIAVRADRVAPAEPEQEPIDISSGADALMSAWQGSWLMIVPASAACDDSCEQRLFHVRQVRLTTGRERSRVKKVWLVADQAPLPTTLLSEYPGFDVLRIDAEQLAARFPAEPGRAATDYIYLADPLGHLMMRWPFEADPSRMKKDLMRLLKASRIG